MAGSSRVLTRPGWPFSGGLLLAFLLACSGVAASPPARFDFVQLCDPQISVAHAHRDVANLKAAAAQIQRLTPPPAFVLICGDLVDVSSRVTQAGLDEGLAAFDLPLHVVPGNHDVIVPPRASSLAAFRARHGGDTFSFDHGGYAFIGVNNQFWFSEVRDVKGNLQKQMSSEMKEEARRHDEWFEEALRQASGAGRPIIVMGHYPVFLKSPDDPIYFGGLMRNLPQPKRKQLFRLFREHGVLAYLSGHVHANYVSAHQGVTYVTTARPGPNISRGRGPDGAPMIDPPGFRIWSVAGAAPLEHRFVPLEGSDGSQ